jgi:putative nucleotidyltransferase with HDIG domain
MLAERDVDIAKVAALIASDPLLSARTLQFANSALFGLAQPVQNVRHALTMLGLERTRSITVTAATAAYSRAALRTAELRRCWQHTIATAVLAEELSRCCHAFTESAYAAGILHDVGRLGLLVAYPNEYESTIRDCASRCLDLLDFERETFGVDHAEAGRMLADRWNLPEDFRVVAGRHHDRIEDPELTLLKIVHIACRLADFFHYDVVKPLQEPMLDEILSGLPGSAQDKFLLRMDSISKRLHSAVHGFDESEDEDDDAAPEGMNNLPIVMPKQEQFLDVEYESITVEPAAPRAYAAQSIWKTIKSLILRMLFPRR